MYLRCLAGDRPKTWLQWLPWAEFCYNMSYQTAVKCTPFRIVYGRDPPTMLSAFRPRGVPGPTSKLSPRVPAQMGRRETEHEGGRNRQWGNPWPSCCPAPRSGALAVGGLQASARESERERERLFGIPFSRAANLLVREPWTFLL
jgi:hypothetical protein